MDVNIGTVTIHRDDWGVPHIRAATEEGGFYGVGYAQAQDHLDLILRYYLVASGELAATFGRSVDFADQAATESHDAVTSDLAQLRWRHVEESRLAFERLSPQLRRNLSAFVAGVQRYVDDHPGCVDYPIPPLEPVMPLALTRMMWWGYAIMDGLAVCLRAGATVDRDVSELTDALARRDREVGASNEWVLMPWRTSCNALIFLSDPHGPLDGLPMFDAEVEAGPVKYAGYHFVGGLLPILGHTRDVAWGLTTGNPRVSDCYAVRVSPDDPRRYLYDGGERTMATREVVVNVKGEDEPVRRTFEYTEHNGVLSPVIARDGDVAYVLSSPYMHVPDVYEEQLYRQVLAGSVGEFRDAMLGLGSPTMNVMAGDRHGDAYYVRAGRVPVRPEGVDVTKPLEGNTAATAWLGIHTLDDLVHSETPECGYMANNNFSPDRMLLDTRGTTLDAKHYPPYVFGDEPGRINSRGRRIMQILPNAHNASIEDAIAWATDDRWVLVDEWQRALRDALLADRREKPLALRRFVHAILNFDGFARADSVAALNFWFWRVAMLSMHEVTDDMLAAVDGGGSGGAWMVTAAERAVDTLVSTYGKTDLPLGEVFRVGRGGRSYPGRSACFPTRKMLPLDNPYDAIHMPLQPMMYGEPDQHGLRYGTLGTHTLRLTIFTDPITSYALNLYGQSSDPASPHYVDQARLFSERRLRPAYFNDAELEGHVVSTITLDA